MYVDFNQIHSQLQLTLESETNTTLNHLDLSIRRLRDKSRVCNISLTHIYGYYNSIYSVIYVTHTNTNFLFYVT